MLGDAVHYRLTRITIASAVVLLSFLAFSDSFFAGPGNDNRAIAIIEKAIAAHGGKDRLIAFQKRRMKTTGVLYIDDTKIAFAAELWEHLPNCTKVVAHLKAGEVEQVETRVANNEKVWRKIDNDDAALAPKELQIGMRAGLYSRYIMTLVPILENKGVNLKLLEESMIEKRRVLGVRVSGVDKEDIDLFFDAKSGYLVRCITKPSDPSFKGSALEELFSEFKDFEGLKCPTQSIAYYGGKKF